MGGEIALAAEAAPIATAAIGMYGRAVLAKAWDDVSDVTIKAGLQILQRIFGRKKNDKALPNVIADVAAHPDDSDVLAQPCGAGGLDAGPIDRRVGHGTIQDLPGEEPGARAGRSADPGAPGGGRSPGRRRPGFGPGTAFGCR